MGYIRFVTQDEYDGALALREGQKQSTPPFASLTPAVQKALDAAGLKTVAEAQALELEGLIGLDGIGDASAEKIMALKAG